MTLACTDLLQRCSFLALLAALSGALASAQSIRLNKDLPRDVSGQTGGDALIARVSSDGAWVVYLANPVDGGGIFSAPVDGSAAARRLSAPFAPGLGLAPGPAVHITPTSERVLYVADQATDGAFELWSVPIDGSASPVRINAAFAPGAEVKLALLFTPGGERVVYLADPGANDVHELWSAPVDGSQAPVRLNAPGGDVDFSGGTADAVVAPDGSSVLYLDDETTPGVMELWLAPIDGSAPAVRLHPPLAASADISRFFQVSSDASRVVYLADSATDGVEELWSVPLDGSAAPVRLSGPLDPDRRIGTFEVAADSSGVAYYGDVAVNGRYELYWAAIDGAGAPYRLSGPLVSGGNVSGFELTPDGHVAVFEADAEVDGVVNLYSIPVDASSSRKRLSDAALGAPIYSSYTITPDSTRVVFTTGNFGFNVLWSVPVDGSAAQVGLAEPGQTGVGFQVAPAGSWVAYTLTTSRGLELWSVPVDRSLAPRQLQRARRMTGSVGGYALTSTRAVFTADAVTDSVYELWSRPLDASQPALRLSQDLAADPIVGDVKEFLWTPDGTGVVYRADQELDDRYNLLVAHTDQQPRPRTLWASPSLGEWVRESEISPDSRWLVWRRGAGIGSAALDGSQLSMNFDTGYTRALAIAPDSTRVVFLSMYPASHPPPVDLMYSVPIDGSAPPVRLYPTWADELLVLRFVISPDAARVIFLEVADGAPRLASVSIEGGWLPARELHPPLDPGRTVDPGFQLSPDGSRVVFVADLEQAGVLQLYSAPNGRGVRRIGDPLAVRLHPLLGPDRDVDRAFRISPDGQRVVYAADAGVDEQFELFSASIVGGWSPVQLSGPMVAGGDVGLGITRPGYDMPLATGLPLPQFEISPDGARVVYRADQDADDVFELYSVPIDGSASPVRLHPALAPAGDVELLSARISLDGMTVVYAADALQDDVLELFAASIDASGAPIRLSAPMVAGGDVWTRPGLGAWQAVEISPAGALVAYLADQDTDETIELYAVPLDGSAAPEKLNGTLVAGGDVKTGNLPGHGAPFRFAPDGRQVVYLADQNEDEAVELFLALPDRVRRMSGNEMR